MNQDIQAFNAIIVASTPLQPVHRPDLTQVRGSITFIDGSLLHVRENVVTATQWVDYAYHWQTSGYELIIRWDNAHAVNLPTSPHHCHVDSEENIQPSDPMTLEKVLTIIESRLSETEKAGD